MKGNFREYCETTLLGAVGYCTLEMIWRGRTHWTMAVAGGVCFSAMHFINEKFRRLSLCCRCLLGAGLVTAVELATGCIVNRRFKLGVWDYSERPGNFLGQVCPLYSLLWFLLCIPLCGISAAIRKKISHDGVRA